MPAAKHKRDKNKPPPLDRLIGLLAEIEVARYVGAIKDKECERDNAGEESSDLCPL